MKIIVLAMLVAATPQTRATIHRAFRPDDFEIVWTANPFEAVAAAAQQRPDLLLLDFNQPLHEGWRLLERLRAASPGAPVVVLSAYESIHSQTVANRKAFELRKPVGVAALAEAANTLLKAPLRTTPRENGEVAPGDGAIETQESRATLIERYHAADALPTPYRDWGINE